MLPEGWVECHDPSHGRSYYFNLATQSSQWELPTEPAGVAAPPVAESSTPAAEAASPAPAAAAEPAMEKPLLDVNDGAPTAGGATAAAADEQQEKKALCISIASMVLSIPALIGA